MDKHEMLEWLYESSGPILKYKVANELFPSGARDLDTLRGELLANDEVNRWLNMLGTFRVIHHSRNEALENICAKLSMYGLRRGMKELDVRIKPVQEKYVIQNDNYDFVLYSSLLMLGYDSEPVLVRNFINRVDELHKTVQLGVYDLIMSEDEKVNLPKSWRGKPIYKSGYFEVLPYIYDILGMAYFPKDNADLTDKMEDIIKYIFDERIQLLPGTLYIWYPERRYCHSAGMPKIPGFFGFTDNPPEKLILYLDILTRFRYTFTTEWYRSVIEYLNQFQHSNGIYEFPHELLPEVNGYYLYSGKHMGLGENRRSKEWREIESTYWMLTFKSREEKILDSKGL